MADTCLGLLDDEDVLAGDLQFAEPASTDLTSSGESSVSTTRSSRYMLWIDGVGAWQVCAGQEFVIGAPSQLHPSADIALLANISRKHATVSHHGTDWLLDAQQGTTVGEEPATQKTVLRSGDQICLGERVKLGFRLPSVLSSSAVIDFESDHRPSHSVDGIILLVDQCLLGPRQDHHVRCSAWPDFLVLFFQDGQLLCRSRMALQVDGAAVNGVARLQHGSIVTGDEFRFRVEQME